MACPYKHRVYLAQDVADQDMEEEVPTWDGGGGEPKVGKQLDEAHKEDQLAEFSGVLQRYPGHTCRDNQAIRLPPYRLPHAYRGTVQQELREMLAHDIIEPWTSD